MGNYTQTSEIKRVYLGSPNDILLYPNPARDFITIQSTEPGTTSLTLYDATGREMLRQIFTGSSLTLPLSNLAPGLYYLTLKSQDGTQQQCPIVHF